jgi:hypothetical protein
MQFAASQTLSRPGDNDYDRQQQAQMNHSLNPLVSCSFAINFSKYEKC